jgi:phospholipase/carboxylesterase
MYAWYDIYFENNVKSFDQTKAIISSKSIARDIKIICEEYNCDEKRVTVIGFSQGAILGYSLALSNPGLIKNLVALSGYVEEKIIEFNTKKTQTSIYISHGQNDDTIPFLESKKTLEVLDKKGVFYEFNSFNQSHGVNKENLNSFLNWLKNKY